MNRLLRLGLAWASTFALLVGCGDAPPPAPTTHGSGAPVEQLTSRQPRHRLDLSTLPPEATVVIDRIEHGGPFAYRQDGSVFQNRERRLPSQPTGYYREYTVPTPGERTRGARRIVTGGRPPVVYYYTDDHYRSFTRIPERP